MQAGAGGGSTGGDCTIDGAPNHETAGKGGSQTAGGDGAKARDQSPSGSYLQGATGNSAYTTSGGGGGYYGGGAGNDAGSKHGCGGGGSSYVKKSSLPVGITYVSSSMEQGKNNVAAGTSDSSYPGGSVGNGEILSIL